MAAVSYEGNIYAVGGEGSDCRKLSSVERFDEASALFGVVEEQGAPKSEGSAQHFKSLPRVLYTVLMTKYSPAWSCRHRTPSDNFLMC